MQAEEKNRGGRVRAVLDGRRFDVPPVWMMRQAGRYLPEYRMLRAKVPSFFDLCFNPELAAEITMQPVERFDLDAAILFSDILVIPHALGRKVTFVEGEGPRLEPIDAEGIEKLEREHVLDRLSPVLDTVSAVRARLSREKSLIGFCGAPWTVATYMVAGEATGDQLPARLTAAREPDTFQWLIDRLIVASAAYLAAQIRAGADLVQIFDTWSGVLGEEEFDRWCIEPTRAIVELVRHAEPSARIIGFPKGAGLRLKRYAEMTGVDGIGIDWTVPLGVARNDLQPRVAVQGNLDPAVLLAGGAALAGAVDRICEALVPGRFVFNLGHGILPQTPIPHVEEMLARVRGRA